MQASVRARHCCFGDSIVPASASVSGFVVSMWPGKMSKTAPLMESSTSTRPNSYSASGLVGKPTIVGENALHSYISCAHEFASLLGSCAVLELQRATSGPHTCKAAVQLSCPKSTYFQLRHGHMNIASFIWRTVERLLCRPLPFP